MTHILVTGGAGYIGAHCCKELKKHGFEPVTLDNLIYGHREHVRWGPFRYGDVGNPSHVLNCLSRYKIEAVIHFAAFISMGESVADPQLYYENNVGGTLRLLSSLLGQGIRPLVFSSTAGVYGRPQTSPIAEDHPCSPINPYGRTKRMIEDILKDYDTAYRLKSICLRYFNAAGADPDAELGEMHDPETHLIPLILDAAAGKRPGIEIYGIDYPTPDGTCIRDYIHVTDLARAHVLALQHLLDGGDSDVFNLGQGNGYSVRQVIDRAAQITRRNIPTVVGDRRPGDPPELVASNQKAFSRLGWKPEYTNLDDIIQTAWNWHSRKA
jgi:UDP-glucose 4-epimerase